MKLKDLTLDELECMGYDEIAYLILQESGKKEKLINLYKKVCDLLKLDFESYKDDVAEFFELLSTNKKFIMLDKGYWDLQIKHKLQAVTIEDEEAHDFEEEIEETEEEPAIEDDIFYEGEETDDRADNDLADLVLIDEDEETGM